MTLAALLDGLLAPDNSVRKQAEAAYSAAVVGSRSQVALSLLQVLNADADLGRRGMACVLLRRMFDRSNDGASAWASLEPATQAAVKEGLIAALTQDPQASVVRKLCHCIAEVALVAAGPGAVSWPELLPLVFALASAPKASTRESAVVLFGQLADYAGNTLLVPHAATLQGLLPPLLADSDNTVRIAALSATTALLRAIEDDAVRTPFQGLVPTMMKVLEVSLGEEESAAGEAMEALMELLDAHPLFLRPFFGPASAAMLSIIGHGDFEDDTRARGLEFIVKMAENAPATVRKLPGVVKSVVEACLSLLAGSMEEDPGWVTAEEDFNSYLGVGSTGKAGDSENILQCQAASGLDRLARALGGNTLWPVYFAAATPMLGSPDWRQRVGGLLSLSLVGEGCHAVLAPRIRDIVQSVVAFTGDPHPRVRHACIRSLGQLVLDFTDPHASPGLEGGGGGTVGERAVHRGAGGEGAGGTLSRARDSAGKGVKGIAEAAGDLLLTALVDSAGDKNASVPRLRGLAAASLVNLLDPEHCPPTLLTAKAGALDATLATLFGVLRDVQQAKPREAAMTAIGTVAQVVGDEFGRFYDVFVPLAKQAIASGGGDPSLRSLRNKALESVTLIFEAVGREKAGLDMAEVMNTLVRAQHNGLDGGGGGAEGDADAYRYVMSSLARLGDAMGADFAPYLPYVLPRLLQSAGRMVDVTVTDADAAPAAGSAGEAPAAVGGRTAEFNVEVTGMSSRRVALDEGALDEKMTALETLSTLVDALGVDVPAFRPFIDPSVSVMLGALTSPFASVRHIAAACLRDLLLAALADVSDLAHAQRVLEAVLEPSTRALQKEFEDETRLVLGEAVSELLRVCYESTTDGAAVDVAIPTPALGASSEDREGPTPHTRAVVPLAAVPGVLDALKKTLEECVERREDAKKKFGSNPDADEEELERFEQAMAPEDDFVINIVDSMGYIIKQHRDAVYDMVSSSIGPYLLSWLPNCNAVDAPLRAGAICMCDDLIEFAGAKAHALVPIFVPQMLDSMGSTNSLLKQCAAYGAGVCAIHGGAAFDVFLPSVLQKLGEVVQAIRARKGDNEGITDNAVASIVKIAKHRAASLPVSVDTLMRMALGYLPLRADGIEARLVHGWLVDGLTNQDEFWVGKGNSRISECIVALAKILAQHARNTEDGGDEEDEEDDEGGDELLDEVMFEKAKALLLQPRIVSILKTVPTSLSKKDKLSLVTYELRL